MNSQYQNNVPVFKALSDPGRMMIVDMLSCGELCACKILEKLQISQSTLSHHMKVLCDSGLVIARREGKWMYYLLDAETVEKTMRFYCEITSNTEDCICKNGESCCACDHKRGQCK